jgi:hypothetical protein
MSLLVISLNRRIERQSFSAQCRSFRAAEMGTPLDLEKQEMTDLIENTFRWLGEQMPGR